MANGTTLGTAYIQILPSMEGISSGIKKVLDKEGVDAGESAGEKTGESFASKLGSTIKKAVAGLAIGATIKKSFDLGADLEQQIGGIETMFGESANKMREYANQAYKTAGLSANEYMSNVTSFSASLLQGLGQDTAAASEYANRAMVDMSDNANKFGTDITSIQNAYQGFAKQNYTMLDNLKLGYGGTKEEMERLISDASKMTSVQEQLGITVDESSMSFDNIVNAISVMQESMGVAGTTAEEASVTFSGSFSSMKAAFDNFLAALMMDGKDGVNVEETLQPLIESISTFVFGNLIPAIGRFVGAVVESIPALLESAVAEISQQISNALGGIIDPSIIESALTAIGVALTTFMAIEAFTALPEKISKISESLTALCANPVALVVAAIAGVIVLLVELYNNNEDFRNFINECWTAITTTVGDCVQGICDWWNNTLIPGLESIGQWFSDIWTAITTTVSSAWDAICNFASIGINTVQTVVTTVLNAISTVFSTIWNAIKTTVSTVINTIASIVSAVFNTIKNTISTIWNGINTVISTVINTIKNTISTVFNAIKNVVTSVWNGIKTAITTPITAAKDAVKKIIDTIKGFFNFKISWPSIPMPHFSVKPSGWKIGDLLKGTIPSLGISWYAKAMDEPYMLSSATLIGAGEKGDEVIYGHQQLMNDIRGAVASQNKSSETNINKIEINVVAKDNQSAKEIADIVMNRMQHLKDRNEAVFC